MMHCQELESPDFFQDSGDERTDKELSVCFCAGHSGEVWRCGKALKDTLVIGW